MYIHGINDASFLSLWIVRMGVSMAFLYVIVVFLFSIELIECFVPSTRAIPMALKPVSTAPPESKVGEPCSMSFRILGTF